MIKKIFSSFITNKNANCETSEKTTNKSLSNNKTSNNLAIITINEDEVDSNSSIHNRCFIGDDLNSSSCSNELNSNYNWCKMSHSENNDLMRTASNIDQSSTKVHKQTNSKSKNCKMVECFTDGIDVSSINVSGISRRRILANIDFDADGQFMCSTLIKDANAKTPDDDKSGQNNETRNVRASNFAKVSNHKLELISKQMQEAESVQQKLGNKYAKHQNSLNRRNEHKLNTVNQKMSTLNTKQHQTEDESIYDSRKPFSQISDLSSIEEARFDSSKNNRTTKKYSNEQKFKQPMSRRSLIEHENIRSEMYNSENSTFIDQIKKIQNYHNNQIVHNLNDEDTWFCKTKLYDDTLDEIVCKWTTLDCEISYKIILFERNRRVAKAYIRLPYLIVTGGKIGFDGYSIGLRGFENIYRDQETDFIVKNLDKGVRIKIDDDGNLILRKMTPLSVQVKDWLQQLTEGHGALSDDIIALHGKIPLNRPVKVFDIDRFANNLRKELEKPVPNRRMLAKQCIVAISFGKVTYNTLNSPSWLLVINIHALRMIEKSSRIPAPDYGLSTINDLNQASSKEDSSESSCSNSGSSSDSMNSNSEEDQYYSSGFFNKHNIYTSI